MIHAASREATRVLGERFTAISSRFSTSDGLQGLAAELYSVSDLLVAQPRLRRSLADPTTPAAGRAAFAGSLFDSRLSASAAELVRDAVGLRWSSPWDLPDALEGLGDEALLAAAETDGTLDEVEDELFRFERILAVGSQLSALLDEATVPTPRRVALLRELVAGKVSPVTQALLEHAVVSGRKHGIDRAITALLDASAARRDRSVARVISAVALTDAQLSRLAAVLSDMYGRSINIRVAIEPQVQGGLVIRVGDEIIDGSVSAQLAVARSALSS